MGFDVLFSDRIPNLLAVLASHTPNSTILVRAAYESSKRKNETILTMNRNLNLIVRNGGYADFKNCFYYFAGDASKINNGESYGNFTDVLESCRSIQRKVNFPILPIYFMSDTHVSVFLSLYKSSKILKENFLRSFVSIRLV
jgi:hypothetical protein